MSGEGNAVCQWCGERIDPDDPSLVMGVEMGDFPTFGDDEPVEGLERLFHPACLVAAGPRWQRKL